MSGGRSRDEERRATTSWFSELSWDVQIAFGSADSLYGTLAILSSPLEYSRSTNTSMCIAEVVDRPITIYRISPSHATFLRKSSPRRFGFSIASTEHNVPDTSPCSIRAVERSNTIECELGAGWGGAFCYFEALLFRDGRECSVGGVEVDEGLLR